MSIIYEQLEAACLPVVKHYVRDLTFHDKNAIEANPGVPFLHWSRECGTHIVFLQAADTFPPKGKEVPYLFGVADREHLLNEIVGFANHYRPQATPLVHYYNGITLKQIDHAKAKEISRQYGKMIRHIWSHPKDHRVDPTPDDRTYEERCEARTWHNYAGAH